MNGVMISFASFRRSIIQPGRSAWLLRNSASAVSSTPPQNIPGKLGENLLQPFLRLQVPFAVL